MRGFIFPNKSHAMKCVTFTTDNAADISLALNDKYNRIGCVSHHINLIIKCAFKNVRSAANLLAQCKNKHSRIASLNLGQHKLRNPNTKVRKHSSKWLSH